MSTEDNKFLLRPGEGKVIQVLEERMTFKVMSADTNGLYTLFVSSAQPGGEPPPHIYHQEDEAFFILEGTTSSCSEIRLLSLVPDHFSSLPEVSLMPAKMWGQPGAGCW